MTDTSTTKEAFALSLLTKALEFPKVNDVWYNNKMVTIDGFHFIGCRFDKCQIHVSTSNFILEKCFISNDSIVYWDGEIINAIKLFNRINLAIAKDHPWAVPVYSNDGTISIGTKK